MQVGLPHWRAVSTDSVGVPRNGPLGNVARFEKRAAKHGLKVAFSKVHNRFFIWSDKGRKGNPICHFTCWKARTYEPIPLSDNLLALLLAQWRRMDRFSPQTITAGIMQAQKDRKDQLKREEAAAKYEDAVEATRQAMRRHGMGKRVIYSIGGRA